MAEENKEENTLENLNAEATADDESIDTEEQPAETDDTDIDDSDDEYDDEEYEEFEDEAEPIKLCDIIAIIGFVISIVGVFMPLHSVDSGYFSRSDLCSTIIIPISLLGIIISLIKRHRIAVIPAILNFGVLIYFIYMQECGLVKALSMSCDHSYRFYTIIIGCAVVLLSYLFVGKEKLKKFLSFDLIWITFILVITILCSGAAVRHTDYNKVIDNYIQTTDSD